MPDRRLTSSGQLSDHARHVVLPSDITTTAWPSVRDKCNELGIEFDPWQDGAGRAILAKRASGAYAASVGGVVISIPRQVGKTFLLGAIVFALCLLAPNLTVIWTAHRVRTAAETFAYMQTLAKRKKIEPHIFRVYTGAGDESVRFRNGSRILFGARESGFGRGFSQVGVLVLDEAQILTEKTMEDMVPATNQADNPLILMTGTPPRPIDPGDVFASRRREALAGEDTETLYIEFSAEADAKLDDKRQWAKANPSFPHRTSETSILRMKKLLGSDGSFRREALGIWDADRSAGSRAITAEQWNATAIDDPPAVGVRSFGVAFSADGTRLALAGGLKHDGGVHAELIDALDGSVSDGLAPLADWLAARWRDVAVIVLAGRAGSPVLAQLLRDRKVPPARVLVVSTPQYLEACAVTLDSLRDEAGLVTHSRAGQVPLDESVAVCDRKQRADGAWSWHATTVDGDETPLEAFSLAVWAAKTIKRKPRGDGERRAVIL